MYTFNHKFARFLALVVFTTHAAQTNAQSCSNDALTAKYWQYRENFNKHFIRIDRDSSGCVHDGIGQNPDDPCDCAKHGLSLPATSINQRRNGGIEGLGDRNETGEWYDPDCGDDDGIHSTQGTSWIDDSKHNFLDMGAETPHQMGWYWVVLASEYVLLKENGQLAEAKHTLEELFLGLQAYRRLDITANCVAASRYQEITDGYETHDFCDPDQPCLCDTRYQGKTTKNFDSPCDRNCPFTPNTTGYSGFMLREDATQALEKMHDDSEDKWNIDAIGSSYSMSLKPPCITTFSQACFLVHRQAFMSQDGVIGLLIGLAMIKRLIPENAAITTCEGDLYYPHKMAVDIASALVNRIDNTWVDKISWPGSYNCCDKEVFFSEHDGGVAYATMTGMKQACSYIDGAERHSDAGEWLGWYALTEQTRKLVHGYVISLPFISALSLIPVSFGDNANFWIRLKTLGWDMGGAGTHSLYQDAFRKKHLEIMPIINNILYPVHPNLGIDKEYFRDLLCTAPCEGPCRKTEDYPNDNPAYPSFSCSNTPGWLGHRWETHSDKSDDNRQFNGLDYMALYNLYMLYFPDERTPFYNPLRPNLSADHLLGESAIEGPTVLCPGQTAVYTLKRSNLPASIASVTWTSSEHFTLQSMAENPVSAIYADAAAHGYPYLSASFLETRPILQYFTNSDQTALTPVATIPDACVFTYHKPVSSGTVGYMIDAEMDHCASDYWFNAVGPPATVYNWQVTADPADPNLSNKTVFGHGEHFNCVHPHFPGTEGQLTVNLMAVTNCGEFEASVTVPYECSNDGMNMRIEPNPAQNSITINLVKQDQSRYDLSDPDGVQIRIIPANGHLQSAVSRLACNGGQISIATLPSGVYRVIAVAPDFGPVSSTLVIMK